jgi:hypothetical protein
MVLIELISFEKMQLFIASLSNAISAPNDTRSLILATSIAISYGRANQQMQAVVNIANFEKSSPLFYAIGPMIKEILIHDISVNRASHCLYLITGP